MFRVLLFPLITVFGDMCQDFCTARLGPGACSTGYYCKNDYDCHNLFWTSEEKRQICVLTGHGECTNRFPVLCSEATVALGQTITTTSQSRPIGAVATNPPPDRSRVVALELHFGRPTGLFRTRPFVKLTFRNEGRNLGYFAVFDTGSLNSYIVAESETSRFNRWSMGGEGFDLEPSFIRHNVGDLISRPASCQEGYRFVPPDPGHDFLRSMQFGFDYDGRFFECLGLIQDDITVLSDSEATSFTFNELNLNVVRPPRVGMAAVLSASKLSNFAHGAGIFAVVPSPVSGSIHLNWQLLIGPHAPNQAQDYCHANDPNLRWFPTLGQGDWAINGSMWFERGEHHPRSDIQRIEMVLKTGGSNRVSLTPFMMNLVIAELESFGPRRIPTDERFPRFTNCTQDLLASGLTLRIEPSTQEDRDPIGVSFPLDLKFNPATRICTLQWEIATLGGPNKVVIGTAFLAKVVTIFDTRNRIGMCRRGTSPIRR
jgi:hypothetical protein